MATKLFINMPVRDLQKSMDFFTGMGFTFNPKFTDDTAACMVFSEDGYAMLLTHEKWKGFTAKEICDTGKSAEVMIALSFDTREEVNQIIEKAISGGGREIGEASDMGFMYQRTFEDLDGHTWEPFWMDMSAVPQD